MIRSSGTEFENADIFWYRSVIIKWFSLATIIIGIVFGSFSVFTDNTYTLFAFFGVGFSGISYLLCNRKYTEIAAFVLLIGLTFLIFIRSYSIHSAMNAMFLVLLLMVAALFTNFRYCSILFVLDMIFIIGCTILGVFTLNQFQDPQTGLYYVNTITVLLPTLILAYIICLITSKVLLKGIHSQIKQNQLLHQSQEALKNQEKLASIRILAGGIAHDFNNILTSIMGTTSLIDLENNSTDENQELLDHLQKASNSIGRAHV
jgi:signal transduction histidine kinase